LKRRVEYKKIRYEYIMIDRKERSEEEEIH